MTETYTKAGTKAATPAKLDKAIFGVMPKNHELLKAAYTAYLANGRAARAKTKARGEVSGGGKKPWRQKGTGRARFGSSRNPIWRGGGVAFGPTGNQNYTHKLTTSAKRQAIKQALSLASHQNTFRVIEDLKPTTNKTSELVKLLTKVNADGNTLLVVADKTDELTRTSRNLPTVKLVTARYLNVYDILNADYVLCTKDALSQVGTWLGNAAKKEVSHE